MDDCPLPEELTELLADHLDPARLEPLESHVSICKLCQNRLLEMAGDLDPRNLLLLRQINPEATASESAASDSGARREPAEVPSDVLDRLRQFGKLPHDPFPGRSEERLAGEPNVDDDGPTDRGLFLPRIRGLEILEEIGRGGMGVVYKARQLGINRLVAVKVLRIGKLASRQEIERARRGPEAIARLSHSNIVQIHTIGEHEGLYFGVLEYLDGGTLEAKIAEGPWAPKRAGELVKTLAETVDFIHRRGIVHRDLKPSNILLTSDGVPKIADFGLARVADHDQQLTEMGSVMGSPSYMAPEQAAGQIGHIGPATDLYALGVILYELLTGRPPFRGETRLETLEQVANAVPIPPSSAAAGVPRELDNICLKCLRKEPEARYSSGRELADDLSRFLAGEHVEAQPETAWERGRRFAHRHQALSGAFAILGLLVMFGLVVLSVDWRLVHSAQEHDHQMHRAVEETARLAAAAFQEAEQSLYFNRIQIAQHELDRRNLARARAILSECLPRRGRPDLRERTWYVLWKQCEPTRPSPSRP